METQLHAFLTSALDGGEWSATQPVRFTPGERAPPGTHWTGGWVGPRAGLDTVEERKPGRSAHVSVTTPTELHRFPLPVINAATRGMSPVHNLERSFRN
jgi:hypothetical protein